MTHVPNDHDLLIEINTKLTMHITQQEKRHEDNVEALRAMQDWVKALSNRVQKMEPIESEVKELHKNQDTLFQKFDNQNTKINIGIGIFLAIQFVVVIWSHLAK